MTYYSYRAIETATDTATCNVSTTAENVSHAGGEGVGVDTAWMERTLSISRLFGAALLETALQAHRSFVHFAIASNEKRTLVVTLLLSFCLFLLILIKRTRLY
jgi:hypothetical protein